jgi:hypothetical protein
MLIIVAESLLGSRCDFTDEFVGAIPAGPDAREAMVFFEESIALFEIAPESDQRRLIGMSCCQCFQAVVREPRGENLNRQVLLTLAVD